MWKCVLIEDHVNLVTFTRTEMRKEMEEAEIYSILVDEAMMYLTVSRSPLPYVMCLKWMSRSASSRFVMCQPQQVRRRRKQFWTCYRWMTYRLKTCVVKATMALPIWVVNRKDCKQHSAKALYVHCHAHCLNLVLAESAKSSLHFITFFNLVEKLYVLITAFPKRHTAFVKFQKDLHLENVLFNYRGSLTHAGHVGRNPWRLSTRWWMLWWRSSLI